MPEHPLPSQHLHPTRSRGHLQHSPPESHVASSVSVRGQRDVRANSGWARCCWHLKTEVAACISEAVLCVELRCRHRHRRQRFDRAVLVTAVAPRAIAHTAAVLGDMAVLRAPQHPPGCGRRRRWQRRAWRRRDGHIQIGHVAVARLQPLVARGVWRRCALADGVVAAEARLAAAARLVTVLASPVAAASDDGAAVWAAAISPKLIAGEVTILRVVAHARGHCFAIEPSPRAGGRPVGGADPEDGDPIVARLGRCAPIWEDVRESVERERASQLILLGCSDLCEGATGTLACGFRV